MDKFAVKTAKAPSKKRTKLPSNITAADRARKYKPGSFCSFHVEEGLSFCSSCNVLLDHLRKATVDRHLEADSHKRNEEKRSQSSKQQEEGDKENWRNHYKRDIRDRHFGTAQGR